MLSADTRGHIVAEHPHFALLPASLVQLPPFSPRRSLEWVIGDASQFYSGAAAARGADQTATAASVMAARRMHARLPSISGKSPPPHLQTVLSRMHFSST